MNNKIWFGCAGTAALLAAFIIGPGQAAPQAAAPVPVGAEMARPAKPTRVAVQEAAQPAAVRSAAAQEPAARQVRVVYPSHYSAQH
jgi:hypothetical protein